MADPWNGVWCLVVLVGRARGPGRRSLELLGVAARLDVAGIEPLRWALGVAPATMYSHVLRLARAGLIRRVYDPEGSVLVVTRAGHERALAVGRQAPSGSTYGLGLRHARAVSWVAALLVLRGRAWVSDRELRRLPEWQSQVFWPSSRGTHRPDLGAMIGGERVAVEVELSRKGSRRLRAILAGYEHAITTGALGRLVYVSDRDDVRAVVGQLAGQVGLAPDRVGVRFLADVQAEVRELGADHASRQSRQVSGPVESRPIERSRA